MEFQNYGNFETAKIRKIDKMKKKGETSIRFDFYYVYFVFNPFNQIRAHSISTALSHSFHGRRASLVPREVCFF